MSKVITYHRSVKFKPTDGPEQHLVTQLYKCGVYGIVNNDAAQQGNFTPGQLRSMEKKLQKAHAKGEVASIELTLPITVTDKSGFWEEVSHE